MSEERMKQLEKENERLKRRVKLLEKRLARFRKSDKNNAEAMEELAEEADIKLTLKTPVKKENTCLECGRDLQEFQLGHGIMFSCTNPNCKSRPIVKTFKELMKK